MILHSCVVSVDQRDRGRPNLTDSCHDWHILKLLGYKPTRLLVGTQLILSNGCQLPRTENLTCECQPPYMGKIGYSTQTTLNRTTTGQHV